MASFKEANQTRVALKMKLSNYAWYSGSGVIVNNDDYIIVVTVNELNNNVRKIIPPVIDGVEVKVEVNENKKKI